MLNVFFGRYRSLNDDTDNASSISGHRKAKKSKKPSTKSALSFSKNTRHLDLALSKHSEPAPDLSQRYTRFPPQPAAVSKAHELRPSTASEPTHQRLVISGGQHSNHQRLNLHRTMPKSKPSASKSESSSRGTELDRSGSFMNKPARGWLHPDRQISETGICYGVRVSEITFFFSSSIPLYLICLDVFRGRKDH